MLVGADTRNHETYHLTIVYETESIQRGGIFISLVNSTVRISSVVGEMDPYTNLDFGCL
jgi:hypothetical protein